jgi:peptide/nickel transport system substrate-binding protein
MVKVGEADIAPTIAVQDATDPSMDFSYPNSETSWLRIDTHKAPLDDIRVRKALNLAIDRKAMRGSIFSKDVIPAANAVFAAVAGHNFEIDKEIWPYDPAQAKKLLAEAKKDGVPVDKEITMYGRIGIYPNATEAMEAILAWYKAVGLNVKLRMVEVGEWRRLHTAPFDENRPPNLVQTMHDNNNGDPVFTFQYKYACDGANSTYCDPELDKEIYHAATLTGQERVDAYKKLFRTVYERAIDVMMFHMVGYTRVGKRIVYKPTPSMNTELQVSQIKFK